MPEPARNGVTNFVNHTRLPAGAIQYGLQGRPVKVLETTMRFAINTVFGFGGLLDPAAEMGLPYRETGVDETLHVWGVPDRRTTSRSRSAGPAPSATGSATRSTSSPTRCST